MNSSTSWRTAAVFGLVCALGLGTGAVLHSAGPAGPITLSVPGAMNLAVHCGGDATYFADGEQIEFVPEGTTCDIEAPLSPVMPVRGELELGWASRYKCTRHAMELVCAAI